MSITREYENEFISLHAQAYVVSRFAGSINSLVCFLILDRHVVYKRIHLYLRILQKITFMLQLQRCQPYIHCVCCTVGFNSIQVSNF